MPGYLIHFAAAPKDVQDSPLGLLGLIAPDWWKNKNITKEEYDTIFSKYDDAPPLDEIELLCDKTSGGTHFETHPVSFKNVNFCLLRSFFINYALNPKSIFMKGYMQHLRVDYQFYRNNELYDVSKYQEDYASNQEQALKTLHSDWDKINLAISVRYPEITRICEKLPDKLQDIIRFAPGNPVYVNVKALFDFIDTMRKDSSIYSIISPN